ncbi:hypothetical protein F7725_025549 [Dissostichus mawsoni]|uniref:ENPP1-3/EXOG-like endonuclease/phosphodiesterase domain-containing protein n=1 Tax=Dissostichus mawsoni TaxID=36200 RepID=A0A7J5XBI8_DISMA|nr:hypothetical protein F7725_025549 [Dissostichus mawsoni]
MWRNWFPRFKVTKNKPVNNFPTAYLNEKGDQKYDALLMSNVVPMYPEFKKIWDYFQNTLLKKYAYIYNSINVVTGPAFDYNYDGQYDTPEQIQQYPMTANDMTLHKSSISKSCTFPMNKTVFLFDYRFVSGTNIPIPTHYFAVLTSCKFNEQPVSECAGELQSVSFLLPHLSHNSESCKSTEAESQWVEDLMWFHQARLRDVEWITGLDFYQESDRPIPELLKVKTRPTAAIHRKL